MGKLSAVGLQADSVLVFYATHEKEKKSQAGM